MAKKTNRPKSLSDIPESPDEMLVTKKMLDLAQSALESKVQAVDSKIQAVDLKVQALDLKVQALESKMDAGFNRLEGMIHTVAAETSRTLLLMEEQRSENRMFFEAFGLLRDRQTLLESRVDQLEKR